MEKIRVALTQGDTNGIGLEVVLKAVADPQICELFTPVIFANHALVKHTLQLIGCQDMDVNMIHSADKIRSDRVNVINVGSAPVVPSYGAGTPASGAAAVEALEAACNFIDDGECEVLVTAPICKSAAQVDGFRFRGHTEYLEERFSGEAKADGAGEPASKSPAEPGDGGARMILFNDDLRVMLQTTHFPVSEVSKHILKDEIVRSIRIFNDTLRQSFELERPKIAVLALNPHAGDDGLLGDEEIREIKPAVEECADAGIMVFGPLAADGFYAAEGWREVDGVLAMYHDQGLAPFKALARATGVNYTANLPIVRTSPDHGTAYDIAGQGIADATSMRQAIYAAIDIWGCRERYAEMSENPLKITVRDTKEGKRGEEKV